MNISLINPEQFQDAIDLFRSVFMNSESEEEGTIISALASDLITNTVANDFIGFVGREKETNDIIGAVFFSRLTLPNEQTAFILSPMAIKTEHQGKGLGQKLIMHGIEHLKTLNIDLVFTYGDPSFYSKTGFKQIDETTVKAPHKLSHPEGWLVQSLNETPIEIIHGQTQCVQALNDPKYW